MENLYGMGQTNYYYFFYQCNESNVKTVESQCSDENRCRYAFCPLEVAIVQEQKKGTLREAADLLSSMSQQIPLCTFTSVGFDKLPYNK